MALGMWTHEISFGSLVELQLGFSADIVVYKPSVAQPKCGVRLDAVEQTSSERPLEHRVDVHFERGSV
jgi:hypothetical protein